MKPRVAVERAAMGVIAGAVAFGLMSWTQPRATTSLRTPRVFATRNATFALHLHAPLLTFASVDGALSQDVDVTVVVDEAVQPILLEHAALHPESGGVRARIPIALGRSTADADLEIMTDAANDAVRIQLALPQGPEARTHRFALRAEMASDAAGIFVSGVGRVSERATVSGNALLVELEPHPLAIASSVGPVGVETISEESLGPGEPMRVAVRSPAATAANHPSAELHLVVGASSAGIWRSLAALGGLPTVSVRGRVIGTDDRPHVVGRDAQGSPQVRALTTSGGVFNLEVPASVVQWYAETGPGRASALTVFPSEGGGDLVLDVARAGDIHVAVVDADTGAPLTARLLFHGLDGSVDPNFGPDYRASGAGPLIDSLRGDVTTSLPAGRYRIAATKGIEWSMDAKVVDVVPGRLAEVILAPRHVVPTPGTLGCDLHVHARPSFDAPVTPEDRVLSLAAAGIDFAVPTEHNRVGDYSSAIDTLDLGHEFMSVPGVEVTTYNVGFGHFGVFPFSPAARVPPFKHTTMSAIFRAVRSDNRRYFQLNHPRLPGGIGYFDNIGFDPHGPRSLIRSRVDFDGIEVYNGFDSAEPDRVDQVLRDYWALLDFGWRYTATGSSDSHRIQYQWAGYPRTMVAVDSLPASDALPADPLDVVTSLKKGHATVTSGPLIEFVLQSASPGDEIATPEDPIHGHLRVRAAPWVDVTSVQVVVGQIGGGWTIAQTFDVPTRPTVIGPEAGTLDEARARTIRFDRDLDVVVGPGNGWAMVIARGLRPMTDVLPFVPIAPLAFTNPIYVVRHAAPPPPFPGGAGARRPPIP